MTATELLVVGFGLVGVAALGAWHLAGLRLLGWLRPTSGDWHYLGVLVAFWGLLALHFSEIVWCALMLEAVLAFSGSGSVTGGFGDSGGGLLYLAGVTFTTLGYTDQSVRGPVSLLVMIQSLGGFMLLTWSATFVYRLWAERFR